MFKAKKILDLNEIENKNHLFLTIDDYAEIKSFCDNLKFEKNLFFEKFYDEDSKQNITTYLLEIFNETDLLN